MVKVVPLAPSTMQPGPGFCFDPGPSGRVPGGTPLMLCTSPRVFFQTCGNKFGSFSFGRWSILTLPKGVSPSQSLLTSPQPEPFGVVLLFCLREWLSFFGESAAVQWEFVAANLLSSLTSVLDSSHLASFSLDSLVLRRYGLPAEPSPDQFNGSGGCSSLLRSARCTLLSVSAEPWYVPHQDSDGQPREDGIFLSLPSQLVSPLGASMRLEPSFCLKQTPSVGHAGVSHVLDLVCKHFMACHTPRDSLNSTPQLHPAPATSVVWLLPAAQYVNPVGLHSLPREPSHVLRVPVVLPPDLFAHLLICRSPRRVLPMACVPRDPYPGLLRLFRSSSAYASLPLIVSVHPLSCFLNLGLHSHAHSVSLCAPPLDFASSIFFESWTPLLTPCRQALVPVFIRPRLPLHTNFPLHALTSCCSVRSSPPCAPPLDFASCILSETWTPSPTPRCQAPVSVFICPRLTSRVFPLHFLSSCRTSLCSRTPVLRPAGPPPSSILVLAPAA